MAHEPTPENDELTDAQAAEFELQAAAIASRLAVQLADIPTHIIAAALDILYASMLVDRDSYVSQNEVKTGVLMTEEDALAHITKGIKNRADFIRATMKLAGIGGRLN